MPSEANANNSFDVKKSIILEQLSAPPAQYSDKSPKGAIDDDILDLVNEINAYDGYVTTSSCSGRVSVFLEGIKSHLRHETPISHSQNTTSTSSPSRTTSTNAEDASTKGRWLFISHRPVTLPLADADLASLFQLRPWSATTVPPHTAAQRPIHLKFEPLILHILARDLPAASALLSAAHAAGLRESGAVNLPTPGREGIVMVAVRGTSLAFDNVVGFLDPGTGAARAEVSSAHLRALVEIANAKFEVNAERAARFREALRGGFKDKDEREEKADRRERKRAEGLARQAALRRDEAGDAQDVENERDFDGLMAGLG